MPKNKRPNIVILGGGVGSSTFTKSLLGLPVNLTTIVSAFDDGGSTGAIRREYGGFALGDFRQCILASLELNQDLVKTLNHRFGKGNLHGVNVGNLLLKSFFEQFKDQKSAVSKLHSMFGLKNRVIPISYTFAKLGARLSNRRTLSDQHQIATYLSFAEAPISELFLSKKASINPLAASAIKKADFVLFAPGHFFTSVLPHLYVSGFKEAWKASKAEKIWFVNLLAHRGQDSQYSLVNYFAWFQKQLGARPFDKVVLNKQVPPRQLRAVRHRFNELLVTNKDLKKIRSLKINIETADLVSTSVRSQQSNDAVLRAPLRHDVIKIKKYFEKLIYG